VRVGARLAARPAAQALGARASRLTLGVSRARSPLNPASVDWARHYPHFFGDAPAAAAAAAAAAGPAAPRRVEFADVGCGFGGLLSNLAPVFPDTLILGLEIREPVVRIVEQNIARLRSSGQQRADGRPAGANISVVRTNIMKNCANFFAKGQLSKMFFCFPDPHFKRANHRRRVISSHTLDMFAHALREGGLAYTITDVLDLHEWMVKHFSEHPLFERVPSAALAGDPCIPAMENTDEGKKVTRNKGSKYLAVFRRRAPPPV
jgi:tRNA (guanine-N7-)-methyltransferase